jgi:hypothetical protein
MSLESINLTRFILSNMLFFLQTLVPVHSSQHYLHNLQIRLDAHQYRKTISLDPRTGHGQIVCLDCHCRSL